MGARYALYFAPEDESALWRFGWWWLGRTPEGADAPPPRVPGLAPEHWRAITAAPRRYGFHATLKAPFRLAAGKDEAGLVEALLGFAARQPAFTAPPLRLMPLGRFLALRPSRPSPALDALAAASVRAFDAFRAPMTPEERERRLAAGLTPRQARLMDEWGYPYVLDAFRFHMTLTGPLDDDERERMEAILAPLLAEATAESLPVRSICLFRQASSKRGFQLLRRFPLQGRDD